MLNALITLAFVYLQSPLSAFPPIEVPGGPGKFDFTQIDAKNRLFLACHPGKKAITVVDLRTLKVRDVNSVVECNGVSADSDSHRIYAAGPGEKLVCIDSKTWQPIATLDLAGPGDGVQVDAQHGKVYVANDDGTNLWVVGSKSMKLETTVKIKEAPEYLELDIAKGRVYQPIKSASVVQVIDMKSSKVAAEWKLSSLTGPHGCAIDRESKTLFVVGSNGKLAILDATTGAVSCLLDVTPRTDQIAYDQKLKRLYIPGAGTIQVVQIVKGQGIVIGSVAVDSDCRRVSVEPSTSDVWVAYSNKKGSYVQQFKALK